MQAATTILILLTMLSFRVKAGNINQYTDSLVQKAQSLIGSDLLIERFEVIQKASLQLDQVSDPEIVVKVHQELSNLLWHLGARREAVLNDQIALSLYDDLDPPKPIARLKLIGRIGGLKMEMGYLDSAQYYYQKAATAAKQLAPLWQASTLNNLGILCTRKGQQAKATCYYDSALTFIEYHSHSDSLLAISILDNKADLLHAQGNTNRAINLIKSNLNTLEGMHLFDPGTRSRYINYQLKLIDLFSENENYRAAQEALASLNKYLDQQENIDPLVSIKVLEREYSIALARGANISTISAKLLYAKDSLYQAEQLQNEQFNLALLEMSIARIQNEHQTELSLKEQKALYASQTAKNRLLLTLLIAVLAIALCVSIFLVYRKRIRKKELERAQIEQALAHKTKDVDGLALELAKKQELTNRMLEVTGDLSKASTTDIDKIVEDLYGELRAVSRVDAQRSWMHKEIDTVNTAFFERLHQVHGPLAKTEIELSGLIRLGLGNREVAELRNITTSSARIARYRLKKKLGLPKEEDIEEYLKAI